MKIEDLLIFDMSDDSNDCYLQEPRMKCGSHESDEGCCILAESLGQPIRRAKSTPNLLQIPIPVRSRKKSDDSAVGSAEESEFTESTDKSDNNLSVVLVSPAINNIYKNTSRRASSCFPKGNPLQGNSQPRRGSGPNTNSNNNNNNNNNSNSNSSSGMSLLSMGIQGASVESVESSSTTTVTTIFTPSSILGQLIRPPSVVVSDHDISSEGVTFITLDDLDAEYSLNQLARRRLSDCSTCSTLSLNEPDYFITTHPDDDIPEEDEEEAQKASPWRKIRTIVHQLTPFIQEYKKQRYPWVQLAGHQGNFKAGEKPGTILKKFCEREKEAFEILMNDPLRDFVPKYYGSDDEQNFIQLQDLLSNFENPCVMDCKIGVRTYLEEELLKAKEKPKLRKDMYDKMLQIDPSAPTAEEHQLRGVTKPRYMVWRETISTTATYGFRIEGIRKSDGTSSKDYKTTKLESEVKTAFRGFINGYEHIIKQYLERLHELRNALEQSRFFKSHEVIGSSLLFVHDAKQACIWMIDFAKTIPLPAGTSSLHHDAPWCVGNHEDGYLIGLTHLIKSFEDLID